MGLDAGKAQPLQAPHVKTRDGLLLLGSGRPPVEVVVLPVGEPASEAREVWRARQAGRPNPLVLILVAETGQDSPVTWVGLIPLSSSVRQIGREREAASGVDGGGASAGALVWFVAGASGEDAGDLG